MEFNSRMQALLDQCDPEQEDDLVSMLIDLESQLTIADLMLLLKAAVFDGVSMWESMTFHWLESDAKAQRPISAVVNLPASSLRELAGQARMAAMGLLQEKEKADGWEYVLTPMGARAVEWWAGTLVDELGFRLPEELTTET